jgi:hypothetical protein
MTGEIAAWTSVRTSLIDANSAIDLSALLSDYFRAIQTRLTTIP